MATREHEISIHSANQTKPVATFWWDGEKVRSDDQAFLDHVAEMAPQNKIPRDGVAFLKAVPYAFRNGYMYTKTKNE